MPEIVVSCGGILPARRSTHELALDVRAPRPSPERVNLNLGQVTRRLVEGIPDRVADLVEIASYLYCADQFARRDTPEMQQLGADWYRRFRFHVPVRDLAFWQRREVYEALTETLGFLSEDDYAFEFTRAPTRVGLQEFFDLQDEGARAGIEPDQIALFSGGLDSFAGVSELLLRHREQVVLVSHQSSPMVRSKQVHLVDELRHRTKPGQLLHLSVRVNKGSMPARDFTQRSRSFLFAALGFLTARLFRKTEILFFENGIVSLNLPMAEHVLGARSTRTTHPQLLAGLDRLFSLIAEQSIRVRNPYFWKTKADVVQVIDEMDCGDLIAQTFSCVRVREATQQGKHCGVCSQCLDRRFGVLAASLGSREPANLYATDLFAGVREPGAELVLAESYVLSAIKFASLSEAGFLSRYGQVFRALPHLDGPTVANAARIHQLHVRHGQGVTRVIDREVASVGVAGMLALPESSLLSLIQSQVARQPPMLDPAEGEPPAAEQEAGRPELVRPIRFAWDDGRKRVVFAGGATLTGKAAELFSILLDQFRQDQADNLPPVEYGHVAASTLAERLRDRGALPAPDPQPSPPQARRPVRREA